MRKHQRREAADLAVDAFDMTKIAGWLTHRPAAATGRYYLRPKPSAAAIAAQVEARTAAAQERRP